MPKTRHDVDYGPVYGAVIEEFGDPLGGEPVHSGTPEFDLTNADVYGPFVADDCAVVAEYVPWPHGLSVELAKIVVGIEYDPVRPAELTLELPVVGDVHATVRATLGQLDGTDATAVTAITGLSGDQLDDLGGVTEVQS